MKVHLMAPDTDFDPSALDRGTGGGRSRALLLGDVVQDLELTTLVEVMADGDALRRSAARSALLSPLSTPETVRYRQDVLADITRHPDLATRLADLADRAVTADKNVFGALFSRRPELVLDRSVRVLGLFADLLDELRALAAEHAHDLRSEGLRGFVETVAHELDDDFMAEMRLQLGHLARKDGLVFSAGITAGGQTTGHVLRLPHTTGHGPFSRVRLTKPTRSFTVPDRDEAGLEALAALRDRSLVGVANATAQAVAHVLSFFTVLRGELAFYLGCLTLRDRLEAAGARVAVGEPLPPGTDTLTAKGLYDPCLVLRTGRPAVGNDVDAAGRRLTLVTGANHGGKSTFLRSVGVAQLMLGAGMFVPADALTASLAPRVLTHWAREEDPGLEHGKLDDELARMSAVADEIGPGDLLLSNESFSSTNEAEGSHIALDVLRALTRAGVRVVAVTHLYDLAHEIDATGRPTALFLRAPRAEDGSRSYRLEPGGPLPTSFARDLYDAEFGATAARSQRARQD